MSLELSIAVVVAVLALAVVVFISKAASNKGLAVAVEIDMEEFEAARGDPKVQAFLLEAHDYAEQLIARGHCRCHLAMNCPNAQPET